MDLMVSFHIGLPSMVQAVKSDTRVPLNLRDQDFDEDTKELPPSRPETEITGMSYTLAKGRIARVFGKVVEQANLLTLPHYDEVMALDQELHHAFAAVPPLLRIERMEFSITDSPQLIIQRFGLAVLFHKARCVLHRKYLTKERDHVEFSYSRKAAMGASMELLYIQFEVHEACQPGGPLCKDLWFVSSLALHDLLLAAMIVYLNLIQENEGIALRAGILQAPNNQQTEMITALERSYRIWTETRSMSVDKRKACDVLGNMMERVNSIFRYHSGDQNVSTRATDAAGDKESMSRLSLNGMSSHTSKLCPIISFQIRENNIRKVTNTIQNQCHRWDYQLMASIFLREDSTKGRMIPFRRRVLPCSLILMLCLCPWIL
jgi:hypothetical protein